MKLELSPAVCWRFASSITLSLASACSGSGQAPSDSSANGGSTPIASTNAGGALASGGTSSLPQAFGGSLPVGLGGATTNAGGSGPLGTTATGGQTSSTSSPPLSGGTSATAGGTTAKGGASATAGGTTAKGGASATAGGTTAKGGASATGGATSYPSCIGWADTSAYGVARTTGGEGGPTINITTAAQLTSYEKDATPKILRIMNDLSGEFEINSNTTLVGATAAVKINGSLSISGTASANLSNIIVRNLTINGVTSTEDCLDIRWAHHVCVDHCTFVDGPDGNLDIINEADNVTVAYSKFYYTSAYRPLPGETATNHRYSNLVGNGNGNIADRGKLRVTYHHNWWAEGVIERMPRVRFGQIHVLNNYFSSTGNNYCVGAGIEAKIVVENNFFENVKDPHIFYSGETSAQIVAKGNEYVNVTGLKDAGQGAAFTPLYSYNPEPAGQVKATVMANAGPR